MVYALRHIFIGEKEMEKIYEVLDRNTQIVLCELRENDGWTYEDAQVYAMDNFESDYGRLGMTEVREATVPSKIEILKTIHELLDGESIDLTRNEMYAKFYDDDEDVKEVMDYSEDGVYRIKFWLNNNSVRDAREYSRYKLDSILSDVTEAVAEIEVEDYEEE